MTSNAGKTEQRTRWIEIVALAVAPVAALIISAVALFAPSWEREAGRDYIIDDRLLQANVAMVTTANRTNRVLFEIRRELRRESEDLSKRDARAYRARATRAMEDLDQARVESQARSDSTADTLTQAIFGSMQDSAEQIRKAINDEGSIDRKLLTDSKVSSEAARSATSEFSRKVGIRGRGDAAS